nr:hydrolase [Bradyrhizobium diazoefficiens]
MKTCCAYVLMLCWLADPAQAAGLQLLDSDPALAGAIWYPCAGTLQEVPLGVLSVGPIATLPGVKDCPVAVTNLPLIVFSHGRGAWFGAHHDTAEALADAGFVVAAISHPGDNGNDNSHSDGVFAFGSRPADIVRLLDFLMYDWKDRAAIDPSKVGFFGFSKGGHTGLVLIGAKPDFGRLISVCQEKTGVCQELRDGAPAPNPPQDSRIRAAVIVDPSTGIVFTRETLAVIKIPLQYWRSTLGGPGIGDGSGTARIAELLPGKPELHVVSTAHYGFLAPCSPELAAAVPRICADKPEEFDRVDFHREFNASVERFFREQLLGEHTR